MWQKLIKFSIYGLVFLMPLFWLPFSVEAFNFNKSYLLFALVSIGILAWLGKMIFENKKIVFQRTPLDLYVLIFLAMIILNFWFSKSRVSTLLGFYGRFWPSLVGILSLGGFYFLLTNNVNPKSENRNQNDEKIPKSQGIKDRANSDFGIRVSGLIKVFLWSSFLVVLVSYFSLFGVWQKISALKISLPSLMLNRTFNPIGGSLEQLSMFLAFIMVLIIGLLAFKQITKSVGLLILLFAILGILLIVDFWASWIVLVGGLIFFLTLAFWKRIFKEEVNRLSLAIFILLISFIFLFSNPLTGIFGENNILKNFTNFPEEQVLPQKMSWEISWQALRENPVFGSGVSNFQYNFSKFKPESFLKTNLWQIRFDRAGNHIAEILGTGGIVGMISYGLIVGMFLLISLFIIGVRKSEKRENLMSNSFLIIPLLMTFVALLIGQFVYYQTLTLAFGFWLMLGLGVISWQRPLKERTFSFKEFPEVGLILSVIFWILLIGFLYSYFLIGKLYLAEINYKNYLINPKKNMERLERATKFGELRATYHIALSRAYLQKINQEAATAQPNSPLIADLLKLTIDEGKKAVEIEKNWVASQENLAVIYRDIQGLAQGATNWAITKFEDALKLEPKNPALLTELGKLKLAVNNFEEAEKLFTQALGLKPDYIDPQIQLALLAERKGDTEGAINKLQDLLNKYPFSIEGHFQLGRLYYNQRKYDKAIEQFQAALTLFPNHSNSLYSLGLIYQKRGEKELALRMFEKVLQLNPGNQEVRRRIEELKKQE